MVAVGILDGLRAQGWRDCDAVLKGFVISGSAPTVQPSNPTGTNYARFLDLGNGFVVFQFRFVFDANTVFGTGDHIYAVQLPRPANRASGGADLVNGTAQAWQGSAANPQLNMALRPCLMDPMLYGGNQGMEDYYIQFFVPYLLSAGTGTITGANKTSGNIAHGIGSIPQPWDFTVMPTSDPTANIASFQILAADIDATNFQVRVHTAPSTNPFNFSWKCRMEPYGGATLDLLANHTRPWLWAAGHELSGTIVYEARV